jgi:hypothetical protein
LLDRAKWEYERLKRQHYAPVYWSLGNVLKVVNDALDEHEWSAWRKRHGIDRTKAYRALLFVGAFKSLEEMGDLSIRAAERLAKRRLGYPEPPSDEELRVRRRLGRLLKQTLPDVLSDLAALPATERVLPLIDEVGELFGQIYDLAQRRAPDETVPLGDSAP